MFTHIALIHINTHSRAHTSRLEMGTFSLSRYCSALDIKKGWRNDKQKTASKRADEKENTTTIIKQNNKKHIRKESNWQTLMVVKVLSVCTFTPLSLWLGWIFVSFFLLPWCRCCCFFSIHFYFVFGLKC